MNKHPFVVRKILSFYPYAYAIYDIERYYGVGVQESFYLLDKKTLETFKAIPRYDNETLEMIETVNPLWFAEED